MPLLKRRVSKMELRQMTQWQIGGKLGSFSDQKSHAAIAKVFMGVSIYCRNSYYNSKKVNRFQEPW